VYGYGFDQDGTWVTRLINDGVSCMCNNVAFKHAVLATDVEVESRLLEYAKKHYPFGAEFISAYNGSTGYKVINGKFYIHESYQVVANHSKGASVYCKGKWAEIRPNEVKVNGYVVHKADNQRVQIGCKIYYINDLKKLHDFIEDCGGEYRYDNVIWTKYAIKQVIDEFDKM